MYIFAKNEQYTYMLTKKMRCLLPVLFGFFIMGFVDMSGIASNYVQNDFKLNNMVANFLPMLAFCWFIILSVPTAILQGHIGRKNTALISLIITFFATILPFLYYDMHTLLLAFALLGIGNTMMQVSFNPLLTNIVEDKELTAFLTLGQFSRSIASFLGPLVVIAMVILLEYWKYIFIIYATTTLLVALWLFFTGIRREQLGISIITLRSVAILYKDRYILSLFFAIFFFIGIDVGLNTTIPRYLLASPGVKLEIAGLGTSFYFVARMLGSFIGAFILMRHSSVKYLRWSMALMLGAFGLLLISSQLWIQLLIITLLGIACANVFSIVLGLAMQYKPNQANEITAILLTGVAGGALTPPLMGFVGDLFGQTAALLTLLPCILYILVLAFACKTTTISNP